MTDLIRVLNVSCHHCNYDFELIHLEDLIPNNDKTKVLAVCPNCGEKVDVTDKLPVNVRDLIIPNPAFDGPNPEVNEIAHRATHGGFSS